MSVTTIQRKQYGFGITARRDLWWVAPFAVFIGLGLFVLYATARAIYNADYVVDNSTSAFLLSPLYSPLLIWNSMPSWLSPAFLILWAPGGFRLTCYYYRKAYYRAFFLDPPACSVSERKGSIKNYKGETGLFIFQNLHRFFLYFALIFIIILGVDVYHSINWPNGFGASIATLVLLANWVLLSLYTFSCHSLRHLISGKFDCYSCVAFGETRHKMWKGVSALNTRHMLWAWLSLFMVGFADFYIWMISSGMWTDIRIF